MWIRRRPSREEEDLLQRMAAGHTLKDHRFLDGRKEHLLHGPNGETTVVSADLVDRLRRQGRIVSNMKFPAATYSLVARQ